MGTVPKVSEIPFSRKNQACAEAYGQDCEIQRRGLSRRVPSSAGHTGPTSRDRAQDPGSALEPRLRSSQQGSPQAYKPERALTTPGAGGPLKGPQSLPGRAHSPQSSALPQDSDQPLSTSGKNSPAIFARPTSGPLLGAAPPPEMNGRLKHPARGRTREEAWSPPRHDPAPYSPRSRERILASPEVTRERAPPLGGSDPGGVLKTRPRPSA